MRRLSVTAEGGILPIHMVVSNVFGGRFLAVPAWASAHISKYGQSRDLQVLVGLVSFMDTRTKLANVPISKIAEEVNASKETVKRSLKWLSENGIIEVVERPRPSNNVYRINYVQKVMVSPVTLYGVTDDTIMVSPVTLSGDGNGVTGDPIKMPETEESPLFQEVSEITRIISNREIYKEELKRVASDSGKVEDMILGSDPEDTPTSPSTRKNFSNLRYKEYKKHKPEINALVNHFVYNKKTLMTHTYTQKDRQIVRRTIRLLLDGGLTFDTISLMMDKFFSNENFAFSDSPVLMFASQKVQKRLMDAIGIQLDTGIDPVLLFMINDFNREGLDLPWDLSSDESLREVIIMHGMDLCYRYPEVVASLIRFHLNDFTSPDFVHHLESLNSFMQWRTTGTDFDVDTFRCTAPPINLPVEFLSNKNFKLRPASDTIALAVYTYRRITRNIK